MAEQNSSINLIKQDLKTPLSDFLDPMTIQIRNFSILAIFIIAIIAAATVAIYLTVQGRHQILKITKSNLEKQLANERQKESIFLVIKSRISVVEQVLENLRDISVPYDRALSVVQPPKLKTISINEKSLTTIGVNPASVEDGISLSNSLIDLENQNLIMNSRMNSFRTDKEDTIAGFSFYPVWNTEQEEPEQ